MSTVLHTFFILIYLLLISKGETLEQMHYPKNYIFIITVQKYRFNRLLTKDPSEVTSLEYK